MSFEDWQLLARVYALAVVSAEMTGGGLKDQKRPNQRLR